MEQGREPGRILRIRKHRRKDADLQDIAINTPFNDNYPDARTCYEARCNAHIWAGGNEAYVYCTRMSGAPGGLGLIMEEGAIKGYEVRERSQKKEAPTSAVFPT